ncbi:MAG: hypothetical protein WKG07_49435 [Hymenobacter sp.]
MADNDLAAGPAGGALIEKLDLGRVGGVRAGRRRPERARPH